MYVSGCYNAAFNKILQYLVALTDECLSPHSKVCRLIGEALLHTACMHVVWVVFLDVFLFCLKPMDFLGKFLFQMLEACGGGKAVKICDSLSLRIGPSHFSSQWAWWRLTAKTIITALGTDFYTSGRSYKITWQRASVQGGWRIEDNFAIQYHLFSQHIIYRAPVMNSFGSSSEIGKNSASIFSPKLLLFYMT